MTHQPAKTAPITNFQIRTFAFPLGGIFAIICLWPWIWHGTDVRLWAMLISGALIVPGIVYPRILIPAFKIWMIFAEKVGWFNTRVLLGVIFYGVLTPIGLIRGMCGTPSFMCGFDKQADSYRVVKSPRAPDHMSKSF